jgi:hypothetical protein
MTSFYRHGNSVALLGYYLTDNTVVGTKMASAFDYLQPVLNLLFDQVEVQQTDQTGCDNTPIYTSIKGTLREPFYDYISDTQTINIDGLDMDEILNKDQDYMAMAAAMWVYMDKGLSNIRVRGNENVRLACRHDDTATFCLVYDDCAEKVILSGNHPLHQVLTTLAAQKWINYENTVSIIPQESCSV